MSAIERQAPIDRAALLERVDGDWVMVETLLSLLEQQGPVLEAALQSAVERGSLEDVSRAAHSMASTYGTLAAMPAFHAAKTVERTARTGEMTASFAAVSALEEEIAALKPSLAELADECRRQNGEGH
jgi:hypothetical protein